MSAKRDIVSASFRAFAYGAMNGFPSRCHHQANAEDGRGDAPATGPGDRVNVYATLPPHDPLRPVVYGPDQGDLANVVVVGECLEVGG